MLAVAFMVLVRLLGNIEHLASSHQFLSLLIGSGIRISKRRATSREELLIRHPTKRLANIVGRLSNILRSRRVLWRVAVAQSNARVPWPKICRVVAATATATRSN